MILLMDFEYPKNHLPHLRDSRRKYVLTDTRNNSKRVGKVSLPTKKVVLNDEIAKSESHRTRKILLFIHLTTQRLV